MIDAPASAPGCCASKPTKSCTCKDISACSCNKILVRAPVEEEQQASVPEEGRQRSLPQVIKLCQCGCVDCKCNNAELLEKVGLQDPANAHAIQP